MRTSHNLPAFQTLAAYGHLHFKQDGPHTSVSFYGLYEMHEFEMHGLLTT